jgi:hypothetical protein
MEGRITTPPTTSGVQKRADDAGLCITCGVLTLEAGTVTPGSSWRPSIDVAEDGACPESMMKRGWLRSCLTVSQSVTRTILVLLHLSANMVHLLCHVLSTLKHSVHPQLLQATIRGIPFHVTCTLFELIIDSVEHL